MSQRIFLALVLYSLGHVLAWYQVNSQFVWPWPRNNLLFSVALLATPTGICFAYGTRLLMAESGELWYTRFLGFGASYAVFPVMTWYYLNESMFTAKTLVCFFLACLIMYIQFFWK